MKRVKDNMDYVKTPNGAIILDNPTRYNEYMRGHQNKIDEKKVINELRSEIDDLKKLINDLIESNKNKV